MLTITPRPYQFSAAHSLPSMPEGHKCRRMHGHTYQVLVEVGGQLRDGMLPDYAAIDEVVRRHAEPLDHRTLNDIEGLENPTTELLVGWLAVRIRPDIEAIGGRLLGLAVDEGGHKCTWRDTGTGLFADFVEFSSLSKGRIG
jgi:6-pyruvoyltetrahydropterin/6-carboxytetrahydropterin synthase